MDETTERIGAGRARPRGRRAWSRLLLLVAVTALLATACYVPFDFDDDNRADLLSADATGGVWLRGTSPTPVWIGPAGAWTAPGDFDGDEVFEFANAGRDGVWTTSGGRGTFTFAPPPPIVVSGVTTTLYVLPVPADYDGDGDTDPAWYREADATWWIESSAGPIQFGTPAHAGTPDWDVPVPADYDDDGDADIATFSPVTATWHVSGAADVQFGQLGDLPVPGDYDDDGAVEPATVSLRTNTWRRPGQPDVVPIPPPTVIGSFLPAPANYDGVVGDELTFFDSTTNTWHVEGQAPVVAASTPPYQQLPAATPIALVHSVLRIAYLSQ